MITKQYGAALAYVIDQFGGLTDEVESNPTISASGTTQVVPGNADRVSLVIINVGAHDVMVMPESSALAVSSGVGIRLAANGGGISLVLHDDLTMPSRRWIAASQDGSAGSLFVIEQNRNIGIA